VESERTMTEDEIRDAEALREMVVAIMEGAANVAPTKLDGQAVDGTRMLQAFQFITAAMLEAHPEIATPGRMRAESEEQGQRIHGYMRRFREVFQQTGLHAWDEINGPALSMRA
jgi:hypothetical protein